MVFILLGVAFLVLKFAEIGPMAAWNFEISGDLWKFVAPFGLALLWWWMLDATGITRRREMAREAEKVEKRRAERIAALGRQGNKTK